MTNPATYTIWKHVFPLSVSLRRLTIAPGAAPTKHAFFNPVRTPQRRTGTNHFRNCYSNCFGPDEWHPVETLQNRHQHIYSCGTFYTSTITIFLAPSTSSDYSIRLMFLLLNWHFSRPRRLSLLLTTPVFVGIVSEIFAAIEFPNVQPAYIVLLLELFETIPQIRHGRAQLRKTTPHTAEF